MLKSLAALQSNRALALLKNGDYHTKHLWTLQKFYFSSRGNNKLEDLQQKAFISSFLMQFIIDFPIKKYLQKPLSIRQRIINRNEIQAFIIQKINKVQGIGQFKTLDQLGIQASNIQSVIDGFKMEKGIFYDQQIWSKNSMVQSSQLIILNQHQQPTSQTINICKVAETDNDTIQQKQEKKIQDLSKQFSASPESKKVKRKIVLNPLAFSGRIIFEILNKESLLISGDNGIGKSYSYLLYSYLASFILQVRMQRKFFNLVRGIYSKILTKYSNFYKVQKLFYLPVSRLTSQDEYYRLLKLQLTEKAINQQQGQMLSKLQNTPFIYINLYKSLGIGSFVVFDEINGFYSDAMKFIRNKQLGNIDEGQKHYIWRKSQILSQIISLKLILNSSLFVQARLMEDRLQENQLFNIVKHQDYSNRHVHIDYKGLFESIPVRIQTYTLLWFQLTRRLIKNGVPQNLLKDKKWIFQKAFNLQNGKSHQEIIPWRHEIFALDLRLAFQVQKGKNNRQVIRINPQQPINLSKIRDYLIKNEANQEIQAQFKNIKIQIQRIKEKSLQNELQNFIQQGSIITHDRYSRQAIIFFLRFRAHQLVHKNLLSFDANFQSMKQIKFCVLINNSPASIQIPEYQIKILLSSLTIGSLNNYTYTFRINSSPQVFLQKSNFIVQNIRQLLDYFQQIIVYNDSFIHENQYKGFLYRSMRKLFERGYFNFNFILYQQSIKGDIVKYSHSLKIINNTKFKNLEQTKQLKASFDNLFEFIRNSNNDQYIIGLPNTCNYGNFDLALLKKDKKSNIINLITIDVTGGAIEDMINQKNSSIKMSSNSNQNKLNDFFKAAFEQNGIFQKTIDAINKYTFQKTNRISATEITKIAIEISKVIKIRKYIKTLLRQNQILPQKITDLEWKLMKKQLSYSHLATILINIKGDSCSSLKKKSGSETIKSYTQKLFQQLFRLQTAKSQIALQFYALFKLVETLNKCYLHKKQHFINFLQNAYFSKNTKQDITIVPDYLLSDTRLTKKYFFTLFQLLRGYNEQEGISWQHLIAAPSFRIEQYQNNRQNSYLQHHLSADYLYKQYQQQYGLQSKKLSFGFAKLSYHKQAIEILQKPSQLESSDTFSLLKQQFSLLGGLTIHIANKLRNIS